MLILVREGVSPATVVELIDGSMNLVRSRLGNVVNDRATISAIFGALCRDDLNLGDGIRVSEEDAGATNICVVVRLSVKLKIVVAIADPFDENSAPLLFVKMFPPDGATPGVSKATTSNPFPMGRSAVFSVSNSSLI